MANNIGRNNESHVNIKPQDEWQVEEGFRSPDSASIVIRLRSLTPSAINPHGVLYLNLDSFQKLVELQKAITDFVKHQRPIVREHQREQKRLAKEFDKKQGLS